MPRIHEDIVSVNLEKIIIYFALVICILRLCIPFRDENTRKEYEEYTDFDNTKRKRRTISEYSVLLKKLHDQYKPYRMSVLQEWTDKTRIASGKLAKKDFSGFDDSVEKQIENIMADKQRLVRRTQLKRSNYKIIGEDDTKTEEVSCQM